MRVPSSSRKHVPQRPTCTHVPKYSPQKQLQTASTRLSIVQRRRKGTILRPSDSLLPFTKSGSRAMPVLQGSRATACGKSVKTDSLRRLGLAPLAFPCDADRGGRRRRHHCLIYRRVGIHHSHILFSLVVRDTAVGMDLVSTELGEMTPASSASTLACPHPLRVPKSMVRRCVQQSALGGGARATAARLRYLNLPFDEPHYS
jgi:hypothetical protein